jgi:hypothetical protein
MAYDLTQSEFTADETRTFRRWADHFVELGMQRADHSREDPWWDDETYDGYTSNPASYGNSAHWSRALAVLAAAVVGGDTFAEVLDWNWSHTTPGGKDYGWENVLDGTYIGPSGETYEGRYRNSLGYGAWLPATILSLVADVAKHVGYEEDLFNHRTERGTRLLQWVEFYEPYFTVQEPYPYPEHETFRAGVKSEDRDNSAIAAEFRAVAELGLNNVADDDLQAALRRLTTYGGAAQRGRNYDWHILGYNAVLGDLAGGG